MKSGKNLYQPVHNWRRENALAPKRTGNGPGLGWDRSAKGKGIRGVPKKELDLTSGTGRVYEEDNSLQTTGERRWFSRRKGGGGARLVS